MSSHHYRVWFEDDTLLVCKHCLAQGRCELVGDHGSKDSNVFAFAYPRQGNICHAFRHCRVIEPDNEFFDVGTLCLADRHRVRQAKGIMHSADAFFCGRCYGIREGGLSIWKFEKQRVILAVNDGCQLSVVNIRTFIQVLHHHHMHMLEGKELLKVVIQSY